jgi:hypothetical protein
MEQRFTLNLVASAYRAACPVHPDAPFDDVVSYAGRKPN